MLNAVVFAFSQVRLEQDIHSTKGDLNDTNSNIIGTKDKLSQLETGTQDSIKKVREFTDVFLHEHVHNILYPSGYLQNKTKSTKI